MMKKMNWKRVSLLSVLVVLVALIVCPGVSLAADTNADAELIAAEERLVAAQAEYDYWLNCKENVDAGIKDAQAEIAYWKQQVKDSEAERNKAKEEMRVYETEKRTYQQQMRALNAKANSLERELRKLQLSTKDANRYEVLVSQLTELDELRIVLTESTKKAIEAGEQANTIDAEVLNLCALQRQYEIGSDEWNALQAQMDGLMEQSTELRIMQVAAEEEARVAGDKIPSVQAAIEQNSAELSALMGRKVAADAVTQQLNDCRAQQEQTQAALNAVIEAETALRNTAAEKVAEAKQGLADAQKKLSQVRNYKTILQNLKDAKIALDVAQAAYDALK